MDKKRALVVATIERAEAIQKALSISEIESELFLFRRGLVYSNKLLKFATRNIPGLRIIKDKTIADINKKLLKRTKEFQPTYLIATVAENIYPETISELREMGIITINWFTDLFSRWRIIEKIASSYDYFYSSDSAIIDKLKHEQNLANCFYLPEAIQHLPDVPVSDDIEKPFNITFIGSYDPKVWQHREDFLSSVQDLGLNIWGPENWNATSLKKYYRGTARGQSMIEKYQKSKISVEIPWNDGISKGIGTRPFEIMSAGSCLLMYDIREDMHSAFKPGIDYAPFSSKEEFREKAIQYLKDGKSRKKIALAGQNAVMANHTMISRIQSIIKRAEISLR